MKTRIDADVIGGRLLRWVMIQLLRSVKMMGRDSCWCLGVCLLLLPVSNVHGAGLAKIYIASYGSDASDGARGSPKRNFQPALNAVSEGGEIVILDTAGYGLLSITKDVTITCPPGVTGLVSASGNVAGAIIIDAPGASVSLRGLTIENLGNAARGIGVVNVGTLSVTDCVIQGFTFFGIDFSPASSGRLLVTRCTIRNSPSTAALSIQPTAGTTRAFINGCHLESSLSGLLLKGSGVRCTARDTVVVDCNFGYDTEAGALLTLQRCTAIRNSTGVYCSDAGSVVRVDACMISGTGNFNLRQLNSGIIQSRTNNSLVDAANSAFGTYNAQ